MLGLGLGLNKENVKSFEGEFDKLGIASNAVFIFSPYKRLVKSYTGKALKVQRTSDYTSMDIGFNSDGTINQTELLGFCGVSDGLVEIVYNQAGYNNAIQSVLNNKPKVVVAGVFQDDGILFDGIDDYYKIQDYTQIQIIENPLSIYWDIIPLHTTFSWLMTKAEDYSTNEQFVMLIYDGYLLPKIYNQEFAEIPITVGVNLKFLSSWQNKLANGLKSIWNSGTNSSTRSALLVNKIGFFIGVATSDGVNPLSACYKGNIKTFVIFASDEYNNYNEIIKI